MRKSVIRLAAEVSLTALAVGISMAPQAASAKDAQGRYVIAVSLQAETEQVWHFWVSAMEAQAAKRNAVIKVQYYNRDVVKQAGQIEQQLAQLPDAFIFNSFIGDASAPMIDAIREEGIPIVGFDDTIPNSAPDFYVIRDNKQVGVLQAELALKYAPSGNYAFINGGPQWSGYHSIKEGHASVLEGNADVQNVFEQNADWDPLKAQSLAENALSVNQDNLAAIIVMNDGMATGVTAAVQSRDLQGKVYVSGMDGETQALRNVLEGAQTMTVYTDIEDYSVAAVNAAVDLIEGKTPVANGVTSTPAGEVPTHLVKVTAVTKDNICEVIPTMVEGWTSVEAVFGDADACK